MKRKRWWSASGDILAREYARAGMPADLPGFIASASGFNQLWISLLAIAVFVTNTVPLEMQRRVLNAATIDRNAGLVFVLASVYAAIVVLEGAVKLLRRLADSSALPCRSLCCSSERC